MNTKDYNKLRPYSLSRQEKDKFFEKKIVELTLHHYKNSKQYKKIFSFLDRKIKGINLKQVPFLPARLFKDFDLISIPKKKIFKTLLSSGTSGTSPSKIYLDKENAYNQVIVLNKIISTILGKNRLPMLIVDRNPKLINKKIFNARAAAIYGFSIFGKNHTYLLDENNNIDYSSLNNFLKEYGNNNFFIFGFTSFIYENLILKLSNTLLKYNFQKGILLHGGGWKKMEDIKISNNTFKQKLLKTTKLKDVYNYYGLVEQTGSIFIECPKCLCLVTSVYSDILIRDKNFRVVEDGKRGIIQLLSLLPKSYPGHSIITEDIGEVIKNNKCECSKRGKSFRVYGRLKESEIRGCSDI